MNEYIACEEAYKRGYERGRAEQEKENDRLFKENLQQKTEIERLKKLLDSEKVGYRCSECNTTWDSDTKYCPNCGAKMDENALKEREKE